MKSGMTEAEQAAEILRLESKLKACYLPIPEHKQILQSIDDLRRYGRRMDGSAQCGQLSGPTDAGKSMLFTKYQEREDAQPTDDSTPVIRTIMPTPPYAYSDLLDSLVGCFGAMIPSARMPNPKRLERLHTLMRERRTELVMIDEWQHIIDQAKAGAVRPYLAADQVKKDFLEKIKVPVVFNGLPICQMIYEKNKQLKTRRMFTASVNPFDWRSALDRERFSILVATMVDKGEFENAELLDDELIERVHLSTGGAPGAVYKLVFAAVRIAVRKGLHILDRPLLAEAQAIVEGDEPGKVNFFLVPLGEARNGGVPLDESRVTALHSRIARPQRKSPLA